jgi:hypothetical protein
METQAASKQFDVSEDSCLFTLIEGSQFFNTQIFSKGLSCFSFFSLNRGMKLALGKFQ